jgi:hypothetical protein
LPVRIDYELRSNELESAVGLLGPEDVKPDRSRQEIGKLQPRGVRSLVRHHEIERQRRSEGVIAVANASKRLLELAVLLRPSCLANHMSASFVVRLLLKSGMQAFKTEAEGLVVEMLDAILRFANSALVVHRREHFERCAFDDEADFLHELLLLLRIPK